MDKINILYVIWSLGLGGAEQVVISLAKGLDKAKFNPVICCLNEKGKFADELEKTGIQVIALHKSGPLDLSIIDKLVRVIKENNIDIVNTHLWGANLWGRIAAHKAKVKVIATEHNLDTWKNWLHIALDKWLSHWTDKIIAVSESVKYFYTHKVGIDPSKIVVIYNGIDSAKYNCAAADKQEFNIKEGEAVIGIVGRLVPQKGHRYFLLAMKEILKKYGDSPQRGQYPIKGIIIGSGPMENELKRYSQELGLEKDVIFAGLRTDIPRLLKMLDLLVMPSTREGLPMIALEAMAAGVPVIASKVGGTPEVVIDGETGILILPEDPDSLARAIVKCLASSAIRDKIVEGAKKIIEDKFQLAHMIKNTENTYLELIKSKS